MFFLDFTGGVKPYLLDEMDNHLGAVTKVEYRPSTAFYLEDRKSPKTRWKTSLPFPVQVVARVEVIDFFSRGKLTTEYRYHNGYWDGEEREFRGFGMVEQLDSEAFEIYSRPGLHPETEYASVQEHHFSPPVLTRTWFHQGPVEDDSGEWHELDQSEENWAGDPALLGHTESVNTFLHSLPDRHARRDALRCLRGSLLRTELYALDRLVNQDRVFPEDRPYTVSEQAYSVREEAPAAAGSVRRRIYFPYITAGRTTQWERGDDPMTSFAFTRDYDAFGQPRQRTILGMPRRSAKRVPFTAAVVGAVQPDEIHVLATHTRTTFAEPDPGLYIHDRPNDMCTYELNLPPEFIEQDEQGNDISENVIQVLGSQYRAAQNIRLQFEQLQGAHLISHVLNHYDGAAYAGRSDGKVGPFGALTRSEMLVFREEELDAAYGSRRPDYLGGDAALPSGAPQGFGSDLGYHLESASPYVPGYYADTQRRRYDFQETGTPPHGLLAWPAWGVVTAMLDPRGNVTRIRPDQFWLLPELVQGPTGLEYGAVYNYRVMQPESLIDPNGSSTHLRFSPAGLVMKQWLVSRDGSQGGTEAKPETEYAYDLQAYARSRETAQPQPVYIHARQRIWYASDQRGDELIEAREYSDGFGRLLQKRSQAAELTFGASGDDVGLPSEEGAALGAAVGQRIPDRVVVSGWQVYDNKGRTVEKYEPFFSAGWAYQPGAKQGQHAELIYDPRGQLIGTLNPDGSRQRVVYGRLRRFDAPQDFEPTPWESTTYDTNDLAPLSYASDGTSLADRAPAAHHFTPTTTVLNTQGKVIAQLVRNGTTPADWHLTRTRFDVRGNPLEIIDAFGRTAFRHAYDLLNRPLKVDGLDAGLRTSVTDPAGNLVEYRDSKGAVLLRRYDEANRTLEVWAIDGVGAPQRLTQREKVVYGERSGLADALDRNLLGKPYLGYDEAGLIMFERYDFKGNLIEKSRRAVSDQAIAAGWTAHWEDGAQAEADLDPLANAYQTSTTLDALDRPVQVSQPRDAQGNRAVMTVTYNRAGAVQSVRLNTDLFLGQIAYNARGQRVLITYGNGVMARYRYDDRTFRLLRLRSERFSAPATNTWQGAGAPLQDYTYTYDLAGNITSIDERVPGCGIAMPAYSHGHSLDRDRLVREFEYDPIYRLVSANGRACKSTSPRPFEDLSGCGSSPANFTQANAPDLTEPYSETYRYDPAGNMLELAYQSGTGIQQNSWRRTFGMGGQAPDDWSLAPDNRLTSLAVGQNPLNAHAYLFDDNGNLIQQDMDQEHDWDHADRMTGYRRLPQGAPAASVKARYLYGADGQRVKKWVRTNGSPLSDESTVYIEGSFEYQSWHEAGQVRENNHLHVMDGQSRVALVRVGDVHPDDSGEPVQYHLGDHLSNSGVVIGGTNAASSTFLNREEFYPYGETSFGSFGRKRYRYTGKERDEENGCCYHGARYLTPWLCRWISCDPLGPDKHLTLYGYAAASPLVFLDPLGLGNVVGEEDLHPTPEGLQLPDLEKQYGSCSYIDEFHQRTRFMKPGTPDVAFSEEKMVDIPTQFDVGKKSFRGTGVTHEPAWVDPRLRGQNILAKTWSEHFATFIENHGAPENFSLQIIEKDTIAAFNNGAAFNETTIGKSLQRAASGHGLEVEVGSIVKGPNGEWYVSGKFKPIASSPPPANPATRSLLSKFDAVLGVTLFLGVSSLSNSPYEERTANIYDPHFWEGLDDENDYVIRKLFGDETAKEPRHWTIARQREQEQAKENQRLEQERRAYEAYMKQYELQGVSFTE